MDKEDINALASMLLVGLLANPMTSTTSIQENVAEAFHYADEFARQAKERAAKFQEGQGA